MFKKENSFLVIIILFLAVLICGCQTEERKPLENNVQKEAGLTASDRRVLADRLSKLATEVEGVQKATVVISDITLANDSGNNTATNGNNTNKTDSDISGMIIMVGITITDQVDEAKTKTEVMNKLKQSDKRISQVLVTSDPNLVKKINEVAAGIIKGEPISKYEMDIKQLGKNFRDNDPAF